MEAAETYKAVVSNVFERGKYGPYAVGHHSKLGSITFSLKKPIWEEEKFPESGDVVILSSVRMKSAGWRAFGAKFCRPQPCP